MSDTEEVLMFRCPICNKLSAPRERAVKVVTETREKEYLEEINERIAINERD
jgi:hypothetical protein